MCIPTGYYYGHFNIPMIPTACTSPDLEDRQLYPTLIRCAPTNNKMGHAMGVLVTQYNWKNIAMLTQDISVCDYGVNAILNQMKVCKIITEDYNIVYLKDASIYV